MDMSLSERCSEVERSILAKNDLQKVPVEKKDNIRAYLDEVANNEMITVRVRRARTQNHGGDDWPEKAARFS